MIIYRPNASPLQKNSLVPCSLSPRQDFFSKPQLPITNYQLPITNYQLPITNYQLPITNYQQII
ncbi:hypothetical protein H5968_10255 [Sphaerospermopsis sp. LEGE 00249]|uniref:hypothetical protein n=1 Tax=Sphaerospermopsis sp. LEGE 00249 TaxID=1380707 RepID=UPI00164DF814|nr:hypothetical protein [Sphaerospermopsis sp. LEGE 00249]MBC5795519.1 hypothetical protein [Sphaerospermopsis sp. LEGE 00249]